MSNDTLLRQWALLQAIPPRRKATAQELHQKLLDQGFQVDLRSVQRDLNRLALVFPVEQDTRSRPFGWRYEQHCEILQIPGMDLPTALTFRLAHSFLEPVMPRSTLAALAPHMRRAEQVLQESHLPLQDWPEKVRFVPRGMPLRVPEVPADVMSVVYQALLEEKRFSAVYHSRQQEEAREYKVNPLGLVYRNGLIYLVCTLQDYTDIRQLVLHRMRSAEALDEPAQVPEGFSLDAYIAEHHFEVRTGEDLKLEALFDAQSAVHLYETPVSEDQRLETQPDGRVKLSATVADTLQLRWWLRGFGSGVEVLAPEGLRAEFKREAEALAGRYS